jgi:hypothetical protein
MSWRFANFSGGWVFLRVLVCKNDFVITVAAAAAMRMSRQGAGCE